jgi:hypothetical protein
MPVRLGEVLINPLLASRDFMRASLVHYTCAEFFKREAMLRAIH